MNVHFNILTGEIRSWGSSNNEGTESIYSGCSVINDVELVEIDATLHKVNLQTLMVVQKTTIEVEMSRRPTHELISGVIKMQLVVTDLYMISDYPINAAEKDQWIIYRAKLRDSSKNNPSVEEYLNKIPTSNPEGQDPFVELRERMI